MIGIAILVADVVDVEMEVELDVLVQIGELVPGLQPSV